MSEIGQRLLSLLTNSPAEWEFAPGCDGLRHVPTRILLTPVHAGAAVRVILNVDGLMRPVLTDADQDALFPLLEARVRACRADANRQDETVLRKLLGLS